MAGVPEGVVDIRFLGKPGNFSGEDPEWPQWALLEYVVAIAKCYLHISNKFSRKNKIERAPPLIIVGSGAGCHEQVCGVPRARRFEKRSIGSHRSYATAFAGATAVVSNAASPPCTAVAGNYRQSALHLL